jgi:hypothetical protein
MRAVVVRQVVALTVWGRVGLGGPSARPMGRELSIRIAFADVAPAERDRLPPSAIGHGLPQAISFTNQLQIVLA